MAITSGQLTVGTTPTPVHNAGDDYSRLIVKNTSATTAVFLGGPAVTTTDGYSLGAGEILRLDHAQNASDDLYAVATVSGTVHYLAY